MIYKNKKRSDKVEKFYFEVPSIERKKEAIDYINEFYKYNSEINGTGGLQRYLDNYEGWLKKLEEDYTRIPNEEKVPTRTFFLIRENDNKIIGMINIRLVLNGKLRKHARNIGYSIRSTERRKGYNKINLYLGLLCCKEHGIKEVLLDCDKSNIASAKTMQALGGVLTEEYYDDVYSNSTLQVYTIDVNKSLEKYKDVYMPYISTRNYNIK